MKKILSMRRLMIQKTMLFAFVFGLVVSCQSTQLVAQETSDEAHDGKQIKAEVVEGKIVITTPDGKTYSVDLGEVGGANVILKTEMRSEDGKKSGSSRAILVGPGGTNHQLLFDDSFGDAAKKNFFPELTQLAWSSEGSLPNLSIQLDNQFVIGINCQSVSNAMKAQMDLENGLVVEIVSEDSAALEAGIQVHDILVRAEESSLNELGDLTAVIQTAGEDESSFDLLLVRKGEKQSVTVTPRKRSDTMVELGGDLQRFRFDVSGLPEGAQFHRVLPGLIRQSQDTDTVIEMEALDSDRDPIAKEMAELRKLVEQLREEIRKDK